MTWHFGPPQFGTARDWPPKATWKEMEGKTKQRNKVMTRHDSIVFAFAHSFWTGILLEEGASRLPLHMPREAGCQWGIQRPQMSRIAITIPRDPQAEKLEWQVASPSPTKATNLSVWALETEELPWWPKHTEHPEHQESDFTGGVLHLKRINASEQGVGDQKRRF